jgi:phosphohistidine phosphatase
MSRLFLLRHGEAEPRADSDARRRLTERGLLQVRANVPHLPTQDPIAIYHSPLLRAQQSAELLRPHLNCSEFQCVSWLEPETPALVALAEIMSLSAATVLIVSHNPLLETVAAELAALPLGTYRFATGTLHQINVR